MQLEKKDEIINFVQTIPTYAEMEIGDKKYFLVHEFPGANVHDEVWVRPTIDTTNPVEATKLIIGHTTVLHMTATQEERAEYEAQLIGRGEHPRIHHAEGVVDIDCGCSYQKPLIALGCLRLDDMAEFYVR